MDKPDESVTDLIRARDVRGFESWALPSFDPPKPEPEPEPEPEPAPREIPLPEVPPLDPSGASRLRSQAERDLMRALRIAR